MKITLTKGIDTFYYDEEKGHCFTIDEIFYLRFFYEFVKKT